MTHTAAAVVWLGLILVGYVYLGYPFVLWVMARLRRYEIRQADITPSVTLLISAFNEARSIGEKLKNSLSLDYPSDRLEVIVVSDASTDDTDAIVQRFAEYGVSLLRMPERRGKTSGLNTAVKTARGDIVVFSDANILYQKDAMRALVRNFADPAVGCVTGDSRYMDPERSASLIQENTYWGYERQIRTWESQTGSTVGGDGAIFAIRRELYTPLPPDAINDLVTPLQIVARGYRAVFEPTAIGFEPSAGNFMGEFRRKRRIVNRSWRGVMREREVLNPLHVGLFAWQVWSHKVLRWLVLPFVVAVATSCFIAAPLGLVYQLGAWGFVGSLMLAGIGMLVPVRLGRLAQLTHGVWYFYLINLAAVLGIATAIAGRVEVFWTPERREKTVGS